MAKVFNTIEEVREARASGKGIVMNMVAAVSALKATPIKTPRASSPRDSEFKSDVHSLFVEAKKENFDTLTPLQLSTMYAAAKGIQVPTDAKEAAKFRKKFYEHCLANSDHPAKNCKTPTYHYDSDKKAFSLL